MLICKILKYIDLTEVIQWYLQRRNVIQAKKDGIPTVGGLIMARFAEIYVWEN